MSSESDISNVLEKLDALFRQGDQQAIEAYFAELLFDYEAAGKTDSMEYATLLNELAGWYRGISRYEDSERYFVQMLSILEKNGLQDSVAYARILLNAAGLYRLTNRFDEALDASLTAKAIIEANPQDDEYAFASALNSITLAYLAKGDLSSAESTATESLAFARNSSAAGNHEIATALSNLASVSVRMGSFNKAELLLREALELHEQMEQENFHHGAVLSALGTVLHSQERYSEAVAVFQQSVEATERFFGKNIEYAIGQYNLARTLEALGNVLDATAHQLKALEVTNDLLGADHAKTRKFQEYLTKLQQLADSQADGE
jgi:tetratricopeptide (TPR) repeat protein